MVILEPQSLLFRQLNCRVNTVPTFDKKGSSNEIAKAAVATFDLASFQFRAISAWAMPSRPIQLTDNIHADETPQIYGQRIAWVHEDGHDGEIYLHEGISTSPLTNDNSVYDHPQVSELGVIAVLNPRYIYLFDGS